jgi:hypothetical protein
MVGVRKSFHPATVTIFGVPETASMHVWYRFYLGYIDTAVLQSRTNLLSDNILAANCSNQSHFDTYLGCCWGRTLTSLTHATS